jgi:Zyg-11 family protein
VRLKDASKLSVKGLRTLKGHKIIELEALGLTRATVTDLLGCLGEWSLHNLRLLNVTNSTFMGSNKHCVVVALSKLKNLQVLNVANTEFNKTSLVRKQIFFLHLFIEIFYNFTHDIKTSF